MHVLKLQEKKLGLNGLKTDFAYQRINVFEEKRRILLISNRPQLDFY